MKIREIHTEEGRIKKIQVHVKVGHIGKLINLKVDIEYNDQSEDELLEMIQEQIDFSPIEKELQKYLNEKPVERLIPTHVEEKGKSEMRFKAKPHQSLTDNL